MHIRDLPTPSVLIDRPRAIRNIERMQAAVSARGWRLRPHAKTHKILRVAAWQIERGAVGICCAKVGEAEVFAEAGVKDIRLPYPVHPSKAPRIFALKQKTQVSIIVDHLAIAQGWSEAMIANNETLDVLVKVDVGFHRCGIDPSDPGALAFVQRVAGLPGLKFRGLLSHAGNGYGAESLEALQKVAEDEARLLNTLAAAARGAGVTVEELSVGATPPARFTLKQQGLTEMRPGNYVYFDRSQVALGAGALDDCALTVLAMVVAKPVPDRIILDCGSKTLTTDQGRGFGALAGYGAVFSSLDWKRSEPRIDESLLIERLSEEHATVLVRSGSTTLEPGDLVRVLPNHSCVVSNLVDSVHVVNGADVEETVAVAARGRIA
jgi:D-serine deaminase-like pyridoxal phosphate-dependent protein